MAILNDDNSLGKSHTFLGLNFSSEQDRQPTIKFNIDPEVFFIYRLIPRKSSFLDLIVFFDTTPISRFLGASFSVHDSIQCKSACFWVPVDR
jgi:hypothetical protein